MSGKIAATVFAASFQLLSYECGLLYDDIVQQSGPYVKYFRALALGGYPVLYPFNPLLAACKPSRLTS